MNISFSTVLKNEDEEKDFLKKNPLTPLAIGDIVCHQGWLYEQLKLTSNGITGRLYEYGPYFKKEANGFLNPEINNGWEEIPYWLRGFYPLAVLLQDKRMLDVANKYFEAIFRSVDSDGWFGPAYLKAYNHTKQGKGIPDLYPNMILADALCLYYEYTKDARVLSLFKNYFAFCNSLDNSQLLPSADNRLRWQKIRAGDMLEPLYWYYRQTKDKTALSLARRVYRAIAKSSSSGYIAIHAVDFSQRFAYDAIYSQQSGRQEHFDRSEFEYQKFKTVWGQSPRGIFAADEQIRSGSVDPRQAFEPCGMVELTKNFYSLCRISGSTVYADRTEDIMLNHFPACFTSDYRQISYLLSANGPIRSNYLEAETYNGSKSHDRSYQLMTPNNRCCGHNTGMGWPWYVMNLWQKTCDNGLAMALYAPCEVKTQIGDKNISIITHTDYPFKDNVNIEIRFEGSIPLYFRIPAWCQNCICTINGKEQWSSSQSGGWLRISRFWKSGDTISLTFKMDISLTKWQSNGSVSVDRGPLTYSVRIKEKYQVPKDALAYNHPTPHLWENYEILPDSPWNFGLVDGGEIRVASIEDALAAQPFDETSPPIVLSARAKRIPEWQIQDSCAGELQQSPVYSRAEEEVIEMIPLGCARLRISCLPVVTENPDCARWQPIPSHVPLENRRAPFYESFRMDFVDNGPWKPDEE